MTMGKTTEIIVFFRMVFLFLPGLTLPFFIYLHCLLLTRMKKVSLFFFLSCYSLILTAQSDTLKHFSNGNILLRKQQIMRLLSPDGKELGNWNENLQQIKQWDNSYSIVRRSDSSGKRITAMFDQSGGKFILPFEYDAIRPFNYNKGIYELKKGKKYGFYAVPSGTLIPAEYDFSGRHVNIDWLLLCTADMGYVYDDQLRLRDSIPGMKSIVSRLYSGKKEWLLVELTNGRGILDLQNLLIFRKEWTHVHGIRGTVAIVNTKEGIGLFDLTSKKLVRPYIYNSYWYDVFGDQVFLQKGNNWVMINQQGKPALDFIADDIEYSQREETGGFYFRQKGLWGIMNYQGKIIQKPVWESISTSSLSSFRANYPGKPAVYYYWEQKLVNGKNILTGIRQLSKEEEAADYPDQNNWVREEPKEVIEMRNLPEAQSPVRHEEDQDKVFVKMEIDPAFVKSGENEKTVLRQLTDKYKKEQKIRQTGTVVLKLVVERDGTISSTTVISSSDPLLTEAAKKVLGTITGWKPGMQNGRVVRGEKTMQFDW